MDSPNIDPHLHCQMIFNKDVKIKVGKVEKERFFFSGFKEI